MPADKYFEKFIIRRIVKGVSFCNETNNFIVNDISLSAEDLKSILKEGYRYGYTKAFIEEVISSLSRNISFAPISTRQYNNIDCDNIKSGQHLVIHTLDNTVGRNSIELLFLGTESRTELRFLVLASDRGILIPGDILLSTNKKWSRGYVIQFAVIRGNKRYPSNRLYYQTYAMDFVEFLAPAPVYELIDEDKDVCTLNKTKSDGNNINKRNESGELKPLQEVVKGNNELPAVSNKEHSANTHIYNDIIYYSWGPTVYTPVRAFKPDDLSMQRTNTPLFVITLQNKTTATYVVNPEFNISTLSINEREYLLNELFEISSSNYKRSQFYSDLVTSIANEKPGILKLDNGLWIIDKKIKIKFL